MMKTHHLAVCAAVLAVAFHACGTPFDFRRELETVHREGLRDVSAVQGCDEFAFVDGCCVGDGDFADYLNVSMGVKALPSQGGPVRCTIDPSMRSREYEIAVSAKGVEIRASGERARRQALYHLEDVMSLRRAPYLKFGKTRRRAAFSPRMTHSGWGVDAFPDAHLRQMAHHGFDAILVFVKGVDRTQGGGEHAGINDLIARAEAAGLDTYLYSKVRGFAHPADPDGAKILRQSFGRVAEAHPRAKGMVFVGESSQFPSRDPRVQPVRYQDKNHSDPRPLAGWFPCSDYPDWLSAVRNALHEHSPDMEIVFWTYNWTRAPEEIITSLIPRFPDGVAVLSTFGKGEELRHRNGLVNICRDYTISFPGPTRHFAAEAAAAHSGGRKLYAMVNTGGLTWDFGVIPFQPCPYQWKRRWDAMLAARRDWGLSGLMESHHYGWWPSFISELAKEAFTEGGMPFDEHIRRIAVRDFGESNAERVLEVWRSWSAAAEDYVATNENQYGPFRIGPAFPFNFGGEPVSDGEFPQSANATHTIRWMAYLNYPYNIEAAQKLNILYSALPESSRSRELELLESMRKAFAEGSRAIRRMSAGLSGRMRKAATEMADVGEWQARTVATAINLRLGEKAFASGDRRELLRIARSEYDNAKGALALAERNSRLGYEPSMEYAAGPDQLRWKMNRMERLYGLGGESR